MLDAKETSLLAQMEPEAARHGIEIVTIEVTGAKKAPVVRVFIDTPDGVDFDVLTATQAWLGELLDRIDPFPGAYTLEVSSPGIDRPLRTPDHFRRFVGEEAKVRVAEPIDGRSNFKGTIESATDGAVSLSVDGEAVDIPFGIIRRANLVGTIDF